MIINVEQNLVKNAPKTEVLGSVASTCIEQSCFSETKVYKNNTDKEKRIKELEEQIEKKEMSYEYYKKCIEEKDFGGSQKIQMLKETSPAYRIISNTAVASFCLASQPFIWSFIAGSAPVMAVSGAFLLGGVAVLGGCMLANNFVSEDKVKDFFEKKFVLLSQEINDLKRELNALKGVETINA